MKISSRNKLLVLTVYLLLLGTLLTVYHASRTAKVQEATAELKNVSAEIAVMQHTLAEVDSYRKMLSSRPQILTYVEFLYRTADENRLKFHEVVSDSAPGQTAVDTVLAPSKLRITVKGEFRSVAEYIRTILNQQQISRVTELKMTVDQNNLVGKINIELFSFN
jgi:hypothetical protein